MINWYIDSPRKDKAYLDVVNRTSGSCMNYLCKRLYELDSFEINDIKRIFEKIIEELPILNIAYDDDIIDISKIYIKYNNETKIRFTDNLKGVVRDIKLRKILE